MDEKTEELRELFLDVADDGTVTEPQRRTATGGSETDDRRLAAAVSEMDSKFEFASGCSEDELQAVVERFYRGEDDEAIANALGVSRDEVFKARMDLHLVRETDPPGVDVDDQAWERLRESDREPAALAGELDLSTTAIERAQAVVRARARARRVSNRFQTTFEECLTDADLSTRLAAESRRDGLEDATDGAEVDVEF